MREISEDFYNRI